MDPSTAGVLAHREHLGQEALARLITGARDDMLDAMSSLLTQVGPALQTAGRNILNVFEAGFGQDRAMPDWSQVTDEIRTHAELYERERRGEDIDMPRRLRPCVCGCGQMTRSEFATGHHASYRTVLLRNAAGGDELAQRELEIRGWLPEQGWANYGTAVGTDGRNENRASRRAQVRRSQAELRSLQAQQRQRPGTVRSTIQPGLTVVQPTVVIGPFDRPFGVEIEFVGVAPRVVAQALRNVGLDCRVMAYNHDVVAWWKIVSDASLRAGSHSDADTGELVAPPLQGDAGLEQLRLACQALHAAGVQVNRTCSVHVHHEVRDFTMPDFRRVIRLYTENRNLINQMVAPSRRHSCTYAEHYAVSDLEYLDTENSLNRFASHVGRHRTVNVASFQRYGTIELRQHHGTTDYRKIRAWVRFGQMLLHYTKNYTDGQPTLPTDSLEGFLRGIGLSRPATSYLVQRALEFTNRDVQRAERAARRQGRRNVSMTSTLTAATR